MEFPPLNFGSGGVVGEVLGGGPGGPRGTPKEVHGIGVSKSWLEIPHVDLSELRLPPEKGYGSFACVSVAVSTDSRGSFSFLLFCSPFPGFNLRSAPMLVGSTPILSAFLINVVFSAKYIGELLSVQQISVFVRFDALAT